MIKIKYNKNILNYENNIFLLNTDINSFQIISNTKYMVEFFIEINYIHKNNDNLLIIYNNDSKLYLNRDQTIKLNISKDNIIFCELIDKNIELSIKITNMNYFFIDSFNVVLITSKIKTSKKPFTYSNIRTIYTPTERFNQTIETIISVKKYIPNYYIILFDNSIFNDEEKKILNNNVDLFLNITDNKQINNLTDNNPNKAYGEICQTYFSIKYISKIKINNFFKISGRYVLNDAFNYSKFNNNYNIFKKNMTVPKLNYYYTCLYKIGKNNINKYFDVIIELFNTINISNCYENVSYEIFFPKKLIFEQINTLGIIENIAIRYEKNYI
jgi:hypothetical protein